MFRNIQKRGCPKRRGAIAPLTALLLVFLLAMVAFAVDLAWIVQTGTELQNAADAAALAGSQELMDPYVQYHLPGRTPGEKEAILSDAMTAATARAKEYAAHNTAGGVKNLTLLDADIEFGFTDDKNGYTKQSVHKGYPNTIKLTLRRDATANGALGLFFGPILGRPTTDVLAQASSAIYGGSIQSFSAANGNVRMLPMTYDVAHWNAFLNTGLDPDGGLRTAADGSPILKVYESNKYKGNFGQLALDDDHAGSSEIRDWIDNGLNQADIDVLKSRNLLPLSAHDPNKWDWLGNPGFRASTVMAVNDYVGGVYILPLFKAKDSSPTNYQAGVGQGSKYDYNIVQFVAVRIMPTKQTNREIVVQPVAHADPNALFEPSSILPAGTTTQLTTTFVVPKLTR